MPLPPLSRKVLPAHACLASGALRGHIQKGHGEGGSDACFSPAARSGRCAQPDSEHPGGSDSRAWGGTVQVGFCQQHRHIAILLSRLPLRCLFPLDSHRLK